MSGFLQVEVTLIALDILEWGEMLGGVFCIFINVYRFNKLVIVSGSTITLHYDDNKI